MSQAPEDVVRSAYERFNAGERDPLPDLWHHDAKWIPDRRDPEPAPYLGLVRFSGHGAGSRVAIDMERAIVYTVEREKVRPVEEYFNRAEALEAAGLSELGDVAGEH